MTKKHAFIGSSLIVECSVFAAVYVPLAVAAALFGAVPHEVHAFASILALACLASASLRSAVPSVAFVVAALVALLLGADSVSQILSVAGAAALALRALGVTLSADGERVSA